MCRVGLDFGFLYWVGLDFGFPGLGEEPAEEILETWSWLQREQKAGSRGQSTCTSIYSYIVLVQNMFVHRLFVWRGVGSGMEAT